MGGALEPRNGANHNAGIGGWVVLHFAVESHPGFYV